jgi:D-alanyl-D-alanine-carboxypeptidase/D-alanyl-D-alanine-endopeptidase
MIGKLGNAIILVVLISFSSALSAQHIVRIDGSRISGAALDHDIQELMQRAQVPGMAVAIFNKDHTVYKKTFGYSNAETKAPLKPTTNIYGASLSKSVFALLVMKLVEQGKLDLDKPLQEYLPEPIYDYLHLKKWHDDYSTLKNDTLYKNITARMCLDHTSGFPNWRWDLPDQKLRVINTPGKRYSYSGEGMVYLQVVLEKMLGKSLEQMADEMIFGPLGMKSTAYTFLPAYEKDFAWGHNAKGSLYEKDKDNEARSPSTMETTLNDMSLFIEAVLQHKIVNKKTTAEIFNPQIRLRSVMQMGPHSLKDTNENDGIQLSYGLGFGLLKSPYGWAAFKEGHGNGFQHYMILFPEQRTAVLIMSNSDNAESIFKKLLELTIADKYTPWKWQQYIPHPGL